MRLCLISQDEKSCRFIAERLERNGCSCVIIDSWPLLFRSLGKKELKIDMIVSDFKFMASESFNLFESIKEMGRKIPVIFYNDPFPSDNERISCWIRLNELNYKFIFPSECIRTLSVLNEIISGLQSRAFAPRPVSFPVHSSLSPVPVQEINVAEFRARNNLSPVMFRLFEFLYKNRTREISLEEIGKTLFTEKGAAPARSSVVYSYISRLRIHVENDNVSKIKIIRSSAGCYKLVVLS